MVVDKSKFKNPSYYINTKQSFDFVNDEVTASYGTATAKAIDDVTDEDNKDNRGLKWNHKKERKAKADGILTNTK